MKTEPIYRLCFKNVIICLRENATQTQIGIKQKKETIKHYQVKRNFSSTIIFPFICKTQRNHVILCHVRLSRL